MSLLLLVLLWPLSFLCAQSQGEFGGAAGGNAGGNAVGTAGGTVGGDTAGTIDPLSLVGLTLDDLIRRFGTPRLVYASRGLEEWQDDVVFVYDQGDFYVYKDRVWQVGLKTAMGINAGDPRGVVFLLLGSKAENRGDSIFCSLDEGAWPLALRCEFDNEDKVRVIYIYRTDF